MQVLSGKFMNPSGSTDVDFEEEAVEQVIRNWNFLHLREIWTFGFCKSTLAGFFKSIPASISPVLKEALHLLQWIYSERILQMRTSVGDSFDQVQNHREEFNNEMWDSDFVRGILQFSFEPLTGHRRKISMNARYATLVWKSPKDDVKDRHAQYKCDQIYTDSDLLLLLSDDIIHEFRDGDRFLRLIRPLQSEGPFKFEAVLVCCAISREYTAVGQLHMVC
jgi:hypothetical protein